MIIESLFAAGIFRVVKQVQKKNDGANIFIAFVTIASMVGELTCSLRIS